MHYSLFFFVPICTQQTNLTNTSLNSTTFCHKALSTWKRGQKRHSSASHCGQRGGAQLTVLLSQQSFETRVFRQERVHLSQLGLGILRQVLLRATQQPLLFSNAVDQRLKKETTRKWSINTTNPLHNVCIYSKWVSEWIRVCVCVCVCVCVGVRACMCACACMCVQVSGKRLQTLTLSLHTGWAPRVLAEKPMQQKHQENCRTNQPLTYVCVHACMFMCVAPDPLVHSMAVWTGARNACRCCLLARHWLSIRVFSQGMHTTNTSLSQVTSVYFNQGF